MTDKILLKSTERGQNGPQKEYDVRDYFKKIKVLDKGYIELIDGMVSDPLLKIVNAARVSFAKESKKLTDKDKKLINYLYEHKHFSTYRHSYFTFRIKAPLFIFRQMWKHQVGSDWVEGAESGEVVVLDSGWNEASGRYVEWNPEFYVPKYIREQSRDNKQGSVNRPIGEIEGKDPVSIYRETCLASCSAYKQIIDAGGAREQARGILPQSLYSECVWTISLQALLYYLQLRDDSHAQMEHREYAVAIKEIMRPILYSMVEE
jgi:thymidylate synthase (FAD)